MQIQSYSRVTHPMDISYQQYQQCSSQWQESQHFFVYKFEIADIYTYIITDLTMIDIVTHALFHVRVGPEYGHDELSKINSQGWLQLLH